MSRTRRVIGWTLVGSSLITHVLTVWCYAKQPDSLAAFTVLPIWFWGGFGLILSVFAFCFLRAPLSLIVTALWAVTLSFAMDEAKALSNFSHPVIQPSRQSTSQNSQIIRVATVNCAYLAAGNPIEDLKAWNPDIVLLQQIHPHQIPLLSSQLFGKNADSRALQTNAIITRFPIIREVRTQNTRNQQITIQLPNKTEIEVLNLHLATAATDLRFWNKSSRKNHTINRQHRRHELATILKTLELTTSSHTTPVILGGDFNAPANDVIHLQLPHDFIDSFSAVGRGWGNTFHRRFPILRIDHIYSSPYLQPLSSGTIISKKTDHRILISDLLLNQKP